MLKRIVVVVGSLMLLASAAQAGNPCMETTSAQGPVASGAEGVQEFQRLLGCAKQSVAEAKAQLRALADVKIDELANNLESERDLLDALLRTRMAALAEAEAKIKALEEVRDQLDRQVEALNGEVEELKAEIKQAQANIAALVRQITALVNERDRLAEEVQNLTFALETAKAEIARANARINELEAALETANAEIADLKRERDQLVGLVETLTEELKKVNDENADLKDENTDLKGETADLKIKIADLERLAKWRSEFFGRLKEILGDREGIKIVGDRFVFQSEVLFKTASDELNADGVRQILGVAEAVNCLKDEIPDSIEWVLQVNGHTDIRPMRRGSRFADNWELSTARALSVVKLLQEERVPPNRLAAAGFGQYQPLEEGRTPEAFARNRRIELKLTDDGT